MSFRNILHMRSLSSAVFFIVWIGYASQVEAATIRISNPKNELELAPGETYSGEMVVENPDSEELKVRCYLEDWAYAQGGTGEKKFYPAGTQPLSASRWIQFSPAQETLKAFGRFTARYTITVPQEAEGGHYSVLFFESLIGTAQDEQGVNVLVSGRVGSLFLIHIKGKSEQKGDVTKQTITPPSGNKPLEIITVFKNTGSADISVGGNFLLMDSEGKVAGRGDLTKLYTLPGDEATGKTQWVGRLSPGAYNLILTYDMGQGQSIVKEETIQVA